MIPISIVRFDPAAPCILRAPYSAWEAVLLQIRQSLPKNDPLRAEGGLAIQARQGRENAQTVTLPPELARRVLELAGVG